MSDRAPAATGGTETKTRTATRFEWERAFRKSGVGLGPVAAGLALVTYASADGTNIYPSQRALAEGLGVDRSAFGRWVEELTEMGWLKVVGARPQRQREYRLTIPEVAEGCGSQQPPTPEGGCSQQQGVAALSSIGGGSQQQGVAALSSTTNTYTNTDTRSETNTGTKRGSATPTPDQNNVSAETVKTKQGPSSTAPDQTGTKQGPASLAPDQNNVTAEEPMMLDPDQNNVTAEEPMMLDPETFEVVPIRTLLPEICKELNGAKDQQELQSIYLKYPKVLRDGKNTSVRVALLSRASALRAQGKWDSDEWSRVTS